MKIINICQDDWANFAFDNAVALASIEGIDAVCLKRNKHIANYAEEGAVVSIQSMIEEIKKADIIQFFHDNVGLFNALKPHFKGKHVIAYHTSSIYRRDYASINAAMNPHIVRAVNAMPEFMGKGAKNEIYMVGAMKNITHAKHIKMPDELIKVAHYPSNPIVKGTEKIKSMVSSVAGALSGMDYIKWQFNCETTFINADAQIKRMGECDIYIELFSHVDSLGSPYGNFGITALEAASMGCVVITNCLSREIYEKHYGPIGLKVANTEEEFKKTLTDLLYMDPEQLFDEKLKAKEWFINKHSYFASAQYIKENILPI